MEERKRPIFRSFAKALLWFIGIWAVLLVVLQVALSPTVMGKIADRFASEYIDGNLQFGKIKVDMFRHFPNMGIVMEDVSLTYPADRFDDLEAKGAQGRLMYHGCGETEDTLASFRHFSVGVNMGSLITGKIDIPHVLLVRPRIFAHSYDEENANWNIFRLEESGDTSSTVTALPPITLGRIRLVDRPHIIYTDCRDTLFAAIGVKRIAFNGRLDTRNSSKRKIGLSVDSMMVAGRLAADTIGLGMDKFYIHEHGYHADIQVEAKAMLATRSFGRLRIPITVSGTAELPEDSVPVIAMYDFKAEIAAIPLRFDLLVKMEETPYLNGRFSIDGCRVEDMIDGFAKNIIPAAKDVHTDAAVYLSGTCDGFIGNGQLPDIDVTMTIPESNVSHKDIRHDIRLAVHAGAKTDNSGKINVRLDKAEISTYGLAMKAKAGASDILGVDPLIDVDGSLKASADSLLTFLPDSSGVIATGGLSANLKGRIRMSQINMYKFGQADLAGNIMSENLVIKSPEDSIDIVLNGLDLNIGPEIKTSKRNKDLAVRLLAVSCEIAETDISLKDQLHVKGEGLSLAAKNSVEAMSEADSSKVYPLGGHFTAKKLSVKDAEGMSMSLRETSNSFQMMPKRTNPSIPVLSLTSRNKRIFVRDKTNRLSLRDADVRATAAMNSMERRQKRRAFMDSLALANPDIPRDSLMAQLRSRRIVRELPEWMQEEDFKSKDLNFTLDGMVADYFRKWDLNGRFNIGSGILATPYFPLKNSMRGMKIGFNNNEIKIDSLKVTSGESEIEAKGSLTGLRRALLGRGAYNLNLEISSDKMNANELLAAFNAGAAADIQKDSARLEGASDEEFLEMVVSDSLEHAQTLNALIIVPSNLNAEIKLNAGNISFSDLLIDRLTADVVMKERCMQITNTTASTNMGSGHFEGFYATRSKKNIKTGFNLSLTDITSEKVIAMMPAIDTIMPLLKSFKGQLTCELAATADLDTCMNLIPPTINGVMRFSGKNLTVSDNSIFTDLAKKLKFKNREKASISSMTVEGLIKDNTFEVFPFVLELDRYALALSGLQRLDMSYRYHASIIRSPLLFKVGIDVYGSDFDHMKFKIGKPKYKNTKVPVFSAVIDQTKINLGESIRDIFEKGVEMAVRENEMQKAINEHKENIGYVNAAEQQIEELSAEEQKQYEEEQSRAEASEGTAPIDSLSISRTLNEIILKDKPNDE